MKFLTKKVPLYSLLVVAASCIGVTYFLASLVKEKEYLAIENSGSSIYSNCNYNIQRLGGYKFVHPLMYAEPNCEADALANVKAGIESVIDKYKNDGTITSASVYLRDFKYGNWTYINENKKYSPGSLLKVPELLTFCKMNEKTPGLFNKRITYDKPLSSNKNATYLSKGIVLGKTYTIRELLHYMIAYSDNNATLILNSLIDVPTFKKVFTDLGMAAPDWNASEYYINAKDYSTFLKVLYNGSYLTIEDSEYCTELLSQCDFTKGMISGLPQNCKVAHKFGEGGYSNSPQLSESGIVYGDGFAYLLTVMTNGKDMNKLPEVIGAISKKTHDMMSAQF